MGSIPTDIRPPRCRRRWSRARGGKRKDVAARRPAAVRGIRRLRPRSAPAIPASASSMSTRSCGRRRRRRWRRCSARPRRRRCPIMSATWAGCIRFTASFATPSPTTNIPSDHERELLALNLKRARALPAGKQRYILVNAAQQRLYMYENGKPVDSMVVVVGKPKYPTPMMTAYIRFAALNPYWYVPPDLAGERRRASSCVKQGLDYLDEHGLRNGVRLGRATRRSSTPRRSTGRRSPTARSRSAPPEAGPAEFMGRMKFMFPNQFGRLSARQSAARAVQAKSRALFQRRLRPARGCARGSADGCSAATWTGQARGPSNRCRWPQPGAGLHHLSDRGARRRVDRLFRRRLWARRGEARRTRRPGAERRWSAPPADHSRQVATY